MTDPARIARSLSEAQRKALMAFAPELDSILWCENAEDVKLAHDMMRMGLVDYIGAAGMVGMGLREFGLAVQAELPRISPLDTPNPIS